MKRLLLYSGGADSTLLLYRDKPDACLFVRYGQKHMKEYWFARKHCDATNTPLYEVEIPRLQGSSLTGDSGSFVVPARNLLFAALAANFAEANGFDEILLGCNKDDRKGFPDCCGDFWIAVTEAMKAAQLKVYPRIPLTNFTKKQILRKLDEIGVGRSDVWSCYEGGETTCGKCAACHQQHQQ